MHIRFKNAKILTLSGTELFDGEIRVSDGTIEYIGAEKPAAGESFEREIDCKGNLIMPGFKNAHTHSGMTAMRSMADDMPLSEWLNGCVFPFEAKMTPDDIYCFSKLAILEYLTSGITACMEMYISPFATAKAFDEMGMRCVQVSAINNFSQSLAQMEECLSKIGGEYNSFFAGFHAEYTTDIELMKSVLALAKKYGSPIFMHNSETIAEVDACRQKYGMSPTQLFESIGLFENGGGAYHCTHLSDSDIEIFKSRGLTVVTCPASNLKLASGVAHLSKYLAAGVKLAIGTDGPASNNCLDMFREMFLAATLSKVLDRDASSVDAEKVLMAATVGGAEAMRLEQCDVLAPGKKADFILIDLNQPNMQPMNNVVKNLVYSGSKQNVLMTVINGKVLYENGNFNCADADGIYHDAAKALARIKNELQGGKK